jgi:hypothetical protein
VCISVSVAGIWVETKNIRGQDWRDPPFLFQLAQSLFQLSRRLVGHREDDQDRHRNRGIPRIGRAVANVIFCASPLGEGRDSVGKTQVGTAFLIIMEYHWSVVVPATAAAAR